MNRLMFSRMARRCPGIAPGVSPGSAEPEPFVADVAKGSHNADPDRINVRLIGDTFHFEAHEVVGEEDAPEFLLHALDGK